MPEQRRSETNRRRFLGYLIAATQPHHHQPNPTKMAEAPMVTT
jgi:hypothetical protein